MGGFLADLGGAIAKMTKGSEVGIEAKGTTRLGRSVEEITNHASPINHMLGDSVSGAAWKDTMMELNQAAAKHKTRLIQNAKTNAPAVAEEVSNALNTPIHHTALNEGIVSSAAKRLARTEILGPHDELMLYIHHNAEAEKGVGFRNALHDATNVALQDEARGIEGSEWDKNAAGKSKGSKNQANYTASHPSIYHRPGSFESTVKKATNFAFAPMAGLKHTGQILNVIQANNYTTVAKAMMDLLPYTDSRAKALETIAQSGAMAEVYGRDFAAHFASQNNPILKHLPGSLGEMLHKNWAIPGLSDVRFHQIAISAQASRYTLEQAATDLVGESSRHRQYALVELKRLGIEPEKLIEQRGKPLPEDYEKAMYRAVDKQLNFKENIFNRSIYSQNTVWGRTLTMYHNYPINQSRFIADCLKKEFYDKGITNIGGMLKTLTTLGLLAPNVSNLIQFIADNASGKTDASERLKNRTTQMYDFDSKAHSVRAILANIESVSHIIGFGIYSNAANGAMRYHLLNTLSGPLFSSPAEHVEDALHAVAGKNPRPIERDLLGDFGAPGRFAQRKLLPPKEKKHSGRHTHRRNKNNSNWYDIPPEYLPSDVE